MNFVFASMGFLQGLTLKFVFRMSFQTLFYKNYLKTNESQDTQGFCMSKLILLIIATCFCFFAVFSTAIIPLVLG